MLSTRAPLSALSFALAIFFLISRTDAQRSSYGEACSKILRCDRRSWLGCFSGICDCVKPEEMVFEPNIGKCASKAGERCKYALEHSDGSKSFEFTNCVENSACGEDGFCTCNNDFFETSNGTCSQKGRFSDSCDEEAKCSSTFGLVCKDGKCECEDKTSIYSDEEEQCVGLVGHSCIALKCTVNANCSNSKCICGEDYYHNPEDKCSQRKGLKDKCLDDDQCKNGEGFPLKCRQGTCVCDLDVSIFGAARKHKKITNNYNCHPHEQFYEFEEEMHSSCLGKVSKPCIQGLCAPGSYCMYTQPCTYYSTSRAGTCKCLSGYTQSPRGTCGVGHGQRCDSANVCFSGMACKFYSGSEYRCACRYSNQLYDSTHRKCYSPAGGPCDENTLCIKGTACETFENGLKGTCKCKPGYVQGSTGSCLADFRMPCNSANTCDSLSGLACIEYTCQCNGFQEFSPKLQKCVGLVGSECVLKTEGQCVENARCMKIRDALSVGNCRCTEGFAVSDNYTCIVAATESVPVLAFPVVYDVDTSDSDEG